MALTPDQKAKFDNEGYLVVENLIDDTTLSRLRSIIQDFKDRSRTVTQSDAIFDVGPGHSPVSPKLRRLKDPVKQHPEFDTLMRSDAIVDIVAPLMGGTARFDHSKLNFKPPSGGAKIEWHQDWAFYPHTNDDLLAVGVMIEDCTEENGPLMVIPGSHKGPVHDHHLDDVFVGGIPDAALGDQLNKAVTLTAPAGTISIHHVRTLHASSENLSERERPLLLYAYSAVDAFPVFTEYDITEYDSRILRGEATRVPRCETVPMRIAVPRPKEADSIFDNQAALQAAT